MASSAVLSIRILSDASKASKDVDKLSGRLGKLEAAASKSQGAATKAGAGVLGLAVVAARAASDLQQAQGAVESVFGKSAAAVEAFASTSASRLGVAKDAYLNSAALMGSALQNAGFTAADAATQTDKAFTRSADLAATFGGSAADAMDAINAAVSRGEFDPLEKYAISLNQTAINAELAKRGQDKLTGQQLKNAKAAVALDMIYQQSAKTSGQFARESDTAAGAQQRAAAAAKDAAAQLGTTLLPAVASLATALASGAQFAAQHATAVRVLAAVVGILAAAVFAVNGALKAYRAGLAVAKAAQAAFNSTAGLTLRVWALNAQAAVKSGATQARAAAASAAAQVRAAATSAAAGARAAAAWVAGQAKAAAATVVTTAKIVAQRAVQLAIAAATKAWAAAQWLLNAAMTANPIGLVIAALVLLAAVLVLAWKKSATFRQIVTAAFNAIRVAVGAVVGWFRTFVPAVFAAVATAIRVYVGIYRAVIVGTFNAVRAVVSAVMGAIRSVVSSVWSGVTGIITGGANAILSTIRGIPGRIASLAGAFGSAGRALIGALVNGLRNASGIVTGIAGNVWNAVRGLLNGAIDRINAALSFSIKAGPVSVNINPPDIPHLASGGIVRSPTLALIGEAGPEAVVPLTGRNAPGTGGPVVVEVYLDGTLIDRKVETAVGRQARRVIMRGGAAA